MVIFEGKAYLLKFLCDIIVTLVLLARGAGT